MLKTFTGLAAAAFILVSPALADEVEHRQLGPHVHGQGTLDIAIEGKKISMDLVAPGMDIVGFEHIATTDAQKQAVEKAKAKLLQPRDGFSVTRFLGRLRYPAR